MFNWVSNNEIIDNISHLKAIKKLVAPETECPIFNILQIKGRLEQASQQIKAMIRLSLNCGFMCTYYTELR